MPPTAACWCPCGFENARLPIDVRAIHTTELDRWGEDREGAAFKALCMALEAKLCAPKIGPERRKAQAPGVSICVLPFANMSGDPEQEYFSDGITEDIITDLGKVSALSIVSRNTAFSFKGATTDVGADRAPDQGRLRARRQRAQIRCTGADHGAAGHAATEAQVWGERFDRDLNDIFALQDEISKAIVTALKLTLVAGREARAGTARDEQSGRRTSST